MTETIIFESKVDCIFFSKDKKAIYRVHSLVLECVSRVFRDLQFQDPIDLDATKEVCDGFFAVIYHKHNYAAGLNVWIDISLLLYRYDIPIPTLLLLECLKRECHYIDYVIRLVYLAEKCNLFIYDEALLASAKHKKLPSKLKDLSPKIQSDLLQFYVNKQKR